MRRLIGLVLLALLLLGVPSAAFADDHTTAADVLAVEGEPAGPEPRPRDAEENPARDLAGYDDLEVPFTWGAAWILLFTGMVGLVVLLGVYQLLVRRPSQEGSVRR